MIVMNLNLNYLSVLFHFHGCSNKFIEVMKIANCLSLMKSASADVSVSYNITIEMGEGPDGKSTDKG